MFSLIAALLVSASSYGLAAGCSESAVCKGGNSTCTASSGVQSATCSSSANYKTCSEASSDGTFSQFICCDADGNAVATADATIIAKSCANAGH